MCIVFNHRIKEKKKGCPNGFIRKLLQKVKASKTGSESQDVDNYIDDISIAALIQRYSQPSSFSQLLFNM